MTETKTVVICDWCKKEIQKGRKTIDIGGDIRDCYDICPECLKRLEFIINWKDNQNSILSVNFNSDTEITLGSDGAEAWNNRFSNINIFDNKKEGDIIHSQLHEVCRGLVPAFEKMVGSRQGIAFPFELRFSIKNLRLRDGLK